MCNTHAHACYVDNEVAHRAYVELVRSAVDKAFEQLAQWHKLESGDVPPDWVMRYDNACEEFAQLIDFWLETNKECQMSMQ